MKAIKISGSAGFLSAAGRPGGWLVSEDGQGESEYILMIFCMTVAVFGLKMFNFVLNKAYLDAMNSIRKW
ncbi:hypothetical protein KKF70_03725 [bacterium]|nr:hypothetical protein [Candidatus Omnitrophota bacterium]MBU2528481.1 hypothetical protein [bacterium]MBU3930811.1 hypothetical protein [bacterium]MBU4122404.1 hypothetical protein [bacterium]